MLIIHTFVSIFLYYNMGEVIKLPMSKKQSVTEAGSNSSDLAKPQPSDNINHAEQVFQAKCHLMMYLREKYEKATDLTYNPTAEKEYLQHSKEYKECGRALFAFTDKTGETYIVSFDRKEDGTPDFKILPQNDQLRQVNFDYVEK
jgi:hypothetical protein